jgi:hypothetical protein
MPDLSKLSLCDPSNAFKPSSPFVNLKRVLTRLAIKSSPVLFGFFYFFIFWYTAKIENIVTSEDFKGTSEKSHTERPGRD